MVWRLIAVIWVFALLVGLAVYFSDELFALSGQVLAYDESQRKRVLDLLEISGKALGILGVVMTFFAAVWGFVTGKQAAKSSDSGNTTTFRKKVRVHGDLTLGDKTTHGGKDAG